MKRILKAFTVVALSVVLVGSATGCKQKQVRVETGTIVKCTYGHVVSDNTKTTNVPANEVSKYGVKTETITCDRHKVLGGIYDKAQQAILAGDLKTAEDLLAQVASGDASYRQASAQLAKIRSGQKPTADTGSGGTGTGTGTDSGTSKPPSDKPGDDAPSGPSMNFARYAPDALPGWTGQTPLADPFVYTRPYVPNQQGKAAQLVIVVEQFKDAAAAAAQMNGVMKQDYPQGGAAIKINGKNGYYGARGSSALACFTDGALLVSVEVSATSGDGGTFKAAVIELAEKVAE